MEEFDFIIVGAGSSRCVMAARLSQDPPTQVLLLEAVGRHQHPLIDMPLAWMKVAAMTRFDWQYLTEPEPYLEVRRMPMPRGRLLGGSSSINGTRPRSSPRRFAGPLCRTATCLVTTSPVSSPTAAHG